MTFRALRTGLQATTWLILAIALLTSSDAYGQVLAIQPGVNSPAGAMAGNHTFPGPIGMDFVVNAPIQITSLGVFDAAQNGINAASPLTVELWERNTNGTPSVSDDTGIQVVLSDTFSSGSPGVLNGKFRTKALVSPFTLNPGAYTISASGFSAFNSFWNFGEPHDPAIGAPQPNEAGGAIQFVGTSRFSTTGSGFPGSPDAGPATRYLAGNFVYTPPAFDTLLSVRVNRATGAITLTNGTQNPVNILGYSVTSAFGSLNSNTWTSIAANYDDNNNGTVDPDDNWTRLTASGARGDLSEFEFDGGNGATLASMQSVNLGANAWIATHIEDLVFKYVLGNNTQVEGDVQFSGNGGVPFKLGDLNFDGTAFALNDFTSVMRVNLISNNPSLSQAEAYRLGDMNGDRRIDHLDFRVFKDGFLAGGGSLAALEAAAFGVPEPTSLAVAFVGIVSVLGFRRTRSRSLITAVVALAAVGLHTETSSAQVLALQSPAPLTGNQGFGGELGMDFIVKDLPISVSTLGFFDSGQDGLSTSTIHVELWQRIDGGTPTNPLDDTGGSILASTTFAPGNFGTLVGGNRVKSITSLELAPGAYTIVAGGFSAADPLGNSGEPSFPPIGTPTINGSGGLVQFVGTGRFGNQLAAGNYPATPDGGPANRYHTGTFGYTPAFDPMTLQVNRATGAVTLLNQSTDGFNVDFYELHSNGNSLNPAGWSSLQDQTVTGWLETGVQNASSLTEANLTSSTLFNPAATRSLGNVYNTSVDAQDISFTYVTTGGVSIAAAVQYIGAPVDQAGDYDGDDDVDGNDFLVWQRALGSPAVPPGSGADGNNNGTVEGGDLTVWRSNFGATSTVAAAAVPEPSGLLLLLPAALTLAVFHTEMRRRASATRVLAPACILLLAAASTRANVTNDRDYRMGNDPGEGAVANQVMGSASSGVTFDSSGPSGAFLDIDVNGDPRYVSAVDRPGAVAGALGGSFDGVDDRLSTFRSMNAPTTMWDSADLFPALDYPLNYELLVSHGMQLWAKPNAASAGNRQDVIFDTAQHGIFISADNKWSQRFGFGALESVSASGVQFGQWAHVMHVSGIADLNDGLSPFQSVLLVNGVAVSALGGFYDVNEISTLSIGSNLAGDDNFYHGLVDDARVFLWGNNTGQTNGGGPPVGQNYGRLFLGDDNDWIARQLSILGVDDDADVNLDGSVNQADVAAFIPNWLSRQTVNGVQVGDWNSRQDGDLNYDGAVNLDDAIMLHQGLVAAGGGGLDFALLSVPEPGAATLLVISVSAIAFIRRGRVSL